MRMKPELQAVTSARLLTPWPGWSWVRAQGPWHKGHARRSEMERLSHPRSAFQGCLGPAQLTSTLSAALAALPADNGETLAPSHSAQLPAGAWRAALQALFLTKPTKLFRASTVSPGPGPCCPRTRVGGKFLSSGLPEKK